MHLQFPSPYPDPVLLSYMAVMYPFHAHLMFPAVIAASANVARAWLLVPICASTAWNVAMLDVLTGGVGQSGDKTGKPA